jgi:hypothetical protein
MRRNPCDTSKGALPIRLDPRVTCGGAETGVFPAPRITPSPPGIAGLTGRSGRADYPADTTVAVAGAPHIIGTTRKGSAQMNTPHVLDETIMDFGAIRRRMLRLFLRDNQIDSDERAVLEAFDAEHDELAAYRYRQIAAHSYERNGDTRRTREAFRTAGLQVIDLDAERMARRSNVVPFRTHNEAS